MILVVSLNPAIDRTCKVAELKVGEVNRIKEVRSVAGGKGVNVARVLANFDELVTLTGFLGGSTGREIERAVSELAVTSVFITTVGATRMNTNVVAEDGSVTEILEPGAPISEGEMDTFVVQYQALAAEANVIVLSGSLPTGVPDDFYKTLVEKGHESGCKVILDTAGIALKKAIEAGPDLIKPNVAELEELIGRELSNGDEAMKAGSELVSKGVGAVVISMGAKGLMYVGKDSAIIAMPPKVEAVNTVGCGDSAVAAIAMGIEHGERPAQFLKQAAAISAVNATTLENGDIPRHKVDEILQSIRMAKQKIENNA